MTRLLKFKDKFKKKQKVGDKKDDNKTGTMSKAKFIVPDGKNGITEIQQVQICGEIRTIDHLKDAKEYVTKSIGITDSKFDSIIDEWDTKIYQDPSQLLDENKIDLDDTKQFEKVVDKEPE